jgi:hypothetical protein
MMYEFDISWRTVRSLCALSGKDFDLVSAQSLTAKDAKNAKDLGCCRGIT